MIRNKNAAWHENEGMFLKIVRAVSSTYIHFLVLTLDFFCNNDIRYRRPDI
jgi:hypothetical protein